MSTVISSESMKFSELFHGGRFEIPWHQRRYDWEKGHVSELLRDIDEAIQQESKCYFLGSVMLVKKSRGLWEINDGQQRMVTFSLICACLCRLFSQQNESHPMALALRIMFNLNSTHARTLSEANDLQPRLIPPRDDKTNYNLMIRDEKIGRNGKLTVAWGKIEEFISAKNLEEAKKFLDFLLNKVEVSCLYIPKDKVDPNSLFETLNYRGKRLEYFDLIRNDLYSYFNTHETANRRETVHDNIERIKNQVGGDKKAAEYSRCYFQCRYGFLPEQRFYRATRDKIRLLSGKEEKPFEYVYNLISDFASEAKTSLFRLVSSPNADDQFVKELIRHSATHSCRKLPIFLHELSRYTVTQPMIFALLNKYLEKTNLQEQKNVAKIVHRYIKQITSFVMRTAILVGSFAPSHYEREFSNFAQKIWSEQSIGSLGIGDFLKGCDNIGESIMDNDRFIDKMKRAEIRDKNKAKIFLFGLSHYEQPDRDLIDQRKCTLEHILPKSPNHWQKWEGFEEPQNWVDRIGNLTLLGQADNKSGDRENESFSKKKKFLDRSAISSSRKIAQLGDWSPAEIERRQEKLSKLAARVWSFE